MSNLQHKRRSALPSDIMIRPSASDIVKSFNTWHFKREQPSDIAHLIRVVEASQQCQEPISFVLYWGRGSREHISTPDMQCMDYLDLLRRRVVECYEFGASITLIMTDTHAKLNGYLGESVDPYFSCIAKEAESRGFGSIFLSDVVEAAPVDGCASDMPTTIPHDLLMSLTASASKWYRKEGTPQQGAIAYYQQNLKERCAVGKAHSNAIFITFSSKALRGLLPENLPIFYMYSIRKGVAVKPWFIGDKEAGIHPIPE